MSRTSATPAARRAVTQARLRAQHRAARRRTVLVVTVLTAAAVVLILGEVLLGGTARIPLADALPAMVGRGSGLADYVIFATRMPRALGALVAGLLFGLAGCLYQSVVRNPLATPDIIGITAGATMGAVAVIVLTPGAGLGVQVAGLVGALVMAVTVFSLTWRGGLDTYRLVLVGIGMSAVGTAITTFLLTAAERTAVTAALRWTAGTAAGVTWPEARFLMLVAAAGLVGAAALSRGLGSLGLGDELAAGLGTRVTWVRVGVLTLGAALAALATSVVGPIGFVALVSGPIAARLAPQGPLLVLAPLVGAVVVLAADVLAQNAPLISPVPTGVLTALVGAPTFIWLLLRPRTGVTT